MTCLNLDSFASSRTKMSAINLPEDVCDKLVCLLCKKYLSVNPIYAKKDGTGAICGRCKPPDEAVYFRDERYELLAQFVEFPCIYQKNGCPKSLVTKCLKDH